MADYEYDPYAQFSNTMRMSNIFAPQPYQPNYDYGQNQSSYDPYARFNEIYQPRTQATDMYIDALGNSPQRETDIPWWRHVGAGMAALGAGVDAQGVVGGQPIGFKGNPMAAMGTYDLALNSPYYRQLADYDRRLKDLGVGAGIEDRYNDNSRLLAQSIVSQENADRRLDLTERNNDERNRIAQQRADDYSIRTQVYDYKARNPNVRFDFNGPTVMVADPITGKVTDTGIRTGSLSELDKIQLNQTNAIARQENQGAINKELINQRGAVQGDLIGQRNEASLEQIGARQNAPGSTRTRTIYNAQGQEQGREVIENRPNRGPGPRGSGGTSVLMYGPNGEGPYSIPVDKTDDAQARGMRFNK